MKKTFICIFLSLFMVLSAQAHSRLPDLPDADTAWVDSVMKSLTLEQKIAQLMIIRVFSNRDSIYEDSLIKLVRNWNPGGVCFFKGTPYRQARLTNILQSNAPTPLIISMDAEWGISMRLDSTIIFPRQMTLGAISDNTLIYNMASEIARECKRIGVTMNFAPVVDINNNPLNPVIGSRSFGESVFNVTGKSLAYMAGLQDHGVYSTAKHFPGHGDTDVDSHLGMPVLPFNSTRLDSLELFPFREMIRRGLDGIMNGHLFIPAYDSAPGPSTLSKRVVTGLLRDSLGFKGIAVTDALDMKGVTQSLPAGRIELQALLAGNDILLLPQNLQEAVKVICAAADSGLISIEEIDQKCRKILLMKTSTGLMHHSPVRLDSLVSDLNSTSAQILKKELYKNAITIVKNENDLVPMNFLEYKKIAVISIGDTIYTPFQQMISRYADVIKLNLPLNFDTSGINYVLEMADDANLVIIGVHTSTYLASKRFGIPANVQLLTDTLSSSKKIILDIFGIPYALSLFKDYSRLETIIVSYQDDRVSQEISAEMIFGGVAARGKLPVSGSPAFPINSGLNIEKVRFEYSLPEEVGISSDRVKQIDSIAMEGIEKGAYPGCQVLFAKDGKIFYERSFGKLERSGMATVTKDDIYDLASVTKVVATTLAVMKLHDEGKIDPDKTLGTYYPAVRGSDKENLVIRDIMAHQAGLQPWIPFFEKTISDRKLIPGIYDTVQSEKYPLQVAENLFIRKDYRDSIFNWIIKSPLRTERDYKYSDLGFYLLGRMVEEVTGQRFDRYLDSNFYQPLGLKTMCFDPLLYFPVSRLVPTEDDQLFRKQVVRGYVHDPGAAMLGGVAGHAGVFSNSGDLAVILQMLLNGGNYGGRQYLIPSTIREFTRVQFPENNNRRGMGFDKPSLKPVPDGPVCVSASPASFGHSGFTGTYIWADPGNGLIYVFLSNRVNPDASNQKLSEMNIRTRIHEKMYELLGTERTN